MEVSTASRTLVWCRINLEPNEEFAYKRKWWEPTRSVSYLRVEHDHFEMFYRNQEGTLCSISPASHPQNVFVNCDEIPNMPAQLRDIIGERQAELSKEYWDAQSPTT